MERSYNWETLASRSTPPNDSGSVAVFDGSVYNKFILGALITTTYAFTRSLASILLTPFRTQNVPPPMSSHQLAIPFQDLSNHPRRPHVPVHVTFGPCSDIFAMLWETGYIELSDLRTRLGPGKGKVMDPTTLWTGSVDLEITSREGGYRQVQVWNDTNRIKKGVISLAVLGSDIIDLVVMLSLENGSVLERADIKLPQRNGRLLSTLR